MKELLHSKILESHPLEPLRQIAEAIVETINQSRRIIIVTGAGVSVSGGIPDFRSINGLYNIVKRKYPDACLKGKDLFDARLFNDPLSTKVFYSFMSELKEITNNASVTRSHEFIKNLNEKKKLLRCYTQNIDCLESRLGLSSEMLNNKSNVVMLHGSLSHVICTICKTRSPFSEKHRKVFATGSPPECLECFEKSSNRVAQNKRALPIGILRPDIILYNEHHAAGDWIAECASKDMRKRPDMLIVMGTSLKVCGIKQLVKDLSRQVRATAKQGQFKCVLINKNDVLSSEWKGVFDAKWLGDADEIVDFIEKGLDSRNRRTSVIVKPKKSLKENVDSNQPLITDAFTMVKKAPITSQPGITKKTRESPRIKKTLLKKIVSVNND